MQTHFNARYFRFFNKCNHFTARPASGRRVNGLMSQRLFQHQPRLFSNMERRSSLPVPKSSARSRLSSLLFKTPLIRKRRNLGTDDMMALFSWILLGNGVFFLVSTTTFVSVWLGLLQSIPFQEDILDIIFRRALDGTDLEFKFEKAQMKWKEGFLRLQNVHIKRGTNHRKQVTEFDLNIDELDVKLSLMSWLNGVSLLKEMRINGVIGTMDRRHLDFSNVDPSTWLKRREAAPDDLYLTRLVIENFKIEVMDYNEFRPYSISIHRADLPLLRTNWLLFDFLSADSIVGEYDGSIFTLTKIINDPDYQTFKLRIPNLSIDMINTGATGPFGWITNGFVDVDFMISIPSKLNNVSEAEPGTLKAIGAELETAIREAYENVLDHEHLARLKFGHLSEEQKKLLFATSSDPSQDDVIGIQQSQLAPNVEIFLDLRFNHVRAVMPEKYSGGLSDVMMRAIVAYLNAQATSPRYRKTSTPPISAYLSVPLSDFDGAWTVYQAGLVSSLSEKITSAMIEQVSSSYMVYSQKGKVNTDRPDVRQAPSAGLLIKVAWWGVQQLSRSLLDIVEHQKSYSNTGNSTSDDPLSEVYDEFSRG